MGLRGPNARPKGQKTIEKQPRPSPPRGLAPKSRTVWWRVVLDCPPGHFPPRTHDLLRAFCETCASYKENVAELKKGPTIIVNEKSGASKVNPLYAVIDAQVNRMAQLATKLGLTDPKEYAELATKKSERWEKGLIVGSPNHPLSKDKK